MKAWILMPESRGLLDTSVVIDWHDPEVRAALPEEFAISAITAAELAAGPALASTREEAARRQTRVQEVESLLEPIPFDANTARSFGVLTAAGADAGRTPWRMADLLVAATAHTHGLVLYTRNPDAFTGLEKLVRVVSI